MSIAEGQTAPPFTLPDQQGALRSLDDYRGRHLIVYFYPKDDTPGCTKEACGFRDLWNQIQALGVEVLGVSADSAASHQAFIAKYRLPFPLLTDAGHTMMQQYGAWGEKNRYGKVSTGVIRSTVWIGPDGRIVKHWKKVSDAAAHPEKVLQALRALLGKA